MPLIRDTIKLGEAAELYLGNRGLTAPGGATTGFSGDIDDVRIYSGLLAPSDVEAVPPMGLGLPAQFNSVWTAAGDGNWVDGTNWQEGPPSITDDTANFGTLGGSGPHTVTLNQVVSVGTINIDGTGTYTIAGTGSIILASAGTVSTINVLAGNHTISAKINAGTFNVASPSPVFNIATGASLTVPNFVTFNAGTFNGVTKTGGGLLVLHPFTFGNLLVQGGTLQIQPGTTTGGAFFKPYSLSLPAGATLDITNNNFVSAGGVTDPNAVRADIQTAFNNGNWNGTSTTVAAITSANAAADAANHIAHRTGVAYAVAGSLTSAWIGGANPGGSNILLSYDLMGDADMNGTVDSSDFNTLAMNFNQSGKPGPTAISTTTASSTRRTSPTSR